MDINNLVTMLNQMGDFFEAMPDRKQAKLDLITHVKKFLGTQNEKFDY